jgi:hypothetical protein
MLKLTDDNMKLQHLVETLQSELTSLQSNN